MNRTGIKVSSHQTAQRLRANKKERGFEEAGRILYLKHNIIAILDHQGKSNEPSVIWLQDVEQDA